MEVGKESMKGVDNVEKYKGSGEEDGQRVERGIRKTKMERKEREEEK